MLRGAAWDDTQNESDCCRQGFGGGGINVHNKGPSALTLKPIS